MALLPIMQFCRPTIGPAETDGTATEAADRPLPRRGPAVGDSAGRAAERGRDE
jgi:hypothetical protein